MHSLFSINREFNQGLPMFPAWEWLRRGLTQNLNKTVAYYRRFPGRVDGSHFLIKLIYTMAMPRNLSEDRFYAVAQSKALPVSQNLRMTSSLSRGDLFDGVFYGDGVKEILIAHDENFDYRWAAQNWRNLQPIKVLRHPKSDIGINVPDGVSNSDEEGLAVIAINVPMLVLQYQQFTIYEEELTDITGESPRGVTHFIYSYPLTNMLYSHLDVAIFNRLYNLLIGAPVGESRIKHSFALPDYSQKLMEIQLNQIRALERNPRRFDAMLKMIPMVSSPDLSELSTLPDTAPTRQVVWALVASRLQYLNFLLAASPDKARLRNGVELNRIQRIFMLFDLDLSYKSKFPIDLYLEIRRDIDKIMKN